MFFASPFSLVFWGGGCRAICMCESVQSVTLRFGAFLIHRVLNARKTGATCQAISPAPLPAIEHPTHRVECAHAFCLHISRGHGRFQDWFCIGAEDCVDGSTPERPGGRYHVNEPAEQPLPALVADMHRGKLLTVEGKKAKRHRTAT